MAKAKAAPAPKNLVALPGRLVFADLLKPGAAPSYPDNLRYGVTMQVSKDSDAMEELWASIAAAAKKTWGNDAPERLEAIQGAIDAGIDPGSSPISIDDGDLFNPEYNAGFFIVKARRRADKGAPVLLGVDGEEVVEGDDIPRPGDGVIAMINPWCQPDKKRMNLQLMAVRKAVTGAPIGGGLPQDEIEAGIGALAQISLPTAIPGVQQAAAISAGDVEDEDEGDEETPPKAKKKAKGAGSSNAAARRSRLLELE